MTLAATALLKNWRCCLDAPLLVWERLVVAYCAELQVRLNRGTEQRVVPTINVAWPKACLGGNLEVPSNTLQPLIPKSQSNAAVVPICLTPPSLFHVRWWLRRCWVVWQLLQPRVQWAHSCGWWLTPGPWPLQDLCWTCTHAARCVPGSKCTA